MYYKLLVLPHTKQILVSIELKISQGQHFAQPNNNNKKHKYFDAYEFSPMILKHRDTFI